MHALSVRAPAPALAFRWLLIHHAVIMKWHFCCPKYSYSTYSKVRSVLFSRIWLLASLLNYSGECYNHITSLAYSRESLIIQPARVFPRINKRGIKAEAETTRRESIKGSLWTQAWKGPLPFPGLLSLLYQRIFSKYLC